MEGPMSLSTWCIICLLMLFNQHQDSHAAEAEGSDLNLHDTHLTAHRGMHSRDHKGNDLPSGKEHIAVTTPLFILYSWNYELFRTALDSYLTAGFGSCIIIVDNSADRRVYNDHQVQSMVAEVMRTRVKLTFSQLQNYIADVAIERDYPFYFWGHADVAMTASKPKASISADILDCMEKVMKAEPDWGILYFAYDWFSAIRTDMVRKVQYDIFIVVYGSDCDFYPRVQAAGWKINNYPTFCPDIDLEVHDMKRPLSLPTHNYDRMREALNDDEDVKMDRNAWKVNAMRKGESIGWELWHKATDDYFRAKWGEDENGKVRACGSIGVESEDGRFKLVQEPFAGKETEAQQ